MSSVASQQEARLCEELLRLPGRFHNRWTADAKRHLTQLLFWSISDYNAAYMQVLFGRDSLPPQAIWKLRDYQGAQEGSEYTEAARGRPCGHIFKSGEATYRCKTCTLDDTCVLCSRCFEASDHTDHLIYVSISPGNSGCCDCGDVEAWRIPVKCAIHTADADAPLKQKEQTVVVPPDLRQSINMTIGRALDYICDVIACSPEQLRLTKSKENILDDELQSRLTSEWYGSGDMAESEPEFALVLWNDEKHSIEDVQNQVIRACKRERSFGLAKARETDEIGRSVITFSRDLQSLVDAAIIIEKIKVTVTIRSARDIFREQMCSAIIEWLLDVVGCSVGPDHHILRETVCRQMLQPWRIGSKASNAKIGKKGIDDHEIDETRRERALLSGRQIHDIQVTATGGLALTIGPVGEPNENEAAEDQDSDAMDDRAGNDDVMDVDPDLNSSDVDADLQRHTAEATTPGNDLNAGTTPRAVSASPMTPAPRQNEPRVMQGPSIQSRSVAASDLISIPKTPWAHNRKPREPPADAHWLEEPKPCPPDTPPAEDIRQRVRLDWMILFDLRLWKKARVDLRDLYISTVVTVPEFKRVLGLRFAGLYTVLAQLYLIADREPDHSIIYLSLQMLTTPSITQEIVDKGNFLTSLLAILYTFLTTRQVGHPSEVSPNATLAFDTGSVTNRRMYHFFMDLKHLFASDYVRWRLMQSPHLAHQFLDLVKLSQGICPNVRAVGEHVEYETDAWVSASLLTRELNRLCRQFAEAFRFRRGEDPENIKLMIRTITKATIINSLGAERSRFTQAEIKAETQFKDMSGKGFVLEPAGLSFDPAHIYRVVDFVVEQESISFHHALHYTMSWLIDGAKSLPADEIRQILTFSVDDLTKTECHSQPVAPIADLFPEDYLLAVFDYPLRVCAWLAQMKAGMWVRNGLSLRHQMSSYRGVAQRDLAHQRDIFLLQTALVICNPSRVLLSMIDRFRLTDWMSGDYQVPSGWERSQIIDMAEDFMHLLIVLLVERNALHAVEDEPNPQVLAIRRDIIHILCFRPMSFSDLCGRLADKLQDLDEFQDILTEMTTFKPPEGLSDNGTFELKPEYLVDIDPYILHYSKNQRDEAELAYRNYVSKSTGQPPSEIVLEPRLRAIKSGLFKDLGDFTRTEIFAQTIASALRWVLTARDHSPDVPPMRIEAYLQVVLHLTLAAVLEDQGEYHQDDLGSAQTSSLTPRETMAKSFVERMLVWSPGDVDSILLSLREVLRRDDLAACHGKTRTTLHRAQQKHPDLFATVTRLRGIAEEHLGGDSPMPAAAEHAEAKKDQAREHKARVLAQMQKQQQAFMSNQAAIDWGEMDEDSDDGPEPATSAQEQKSWWKFPAGNCILCQEDTNDGRLYGTFAYFSGSRMLRYTDLQDGDSLREVLDLPPSFDRSAEAIRPYGIAGRNRYMVRKKNVDGAELISERQGLGKGFQASHSCRGTVSTGCGHIMHFSCFELYCSATARRQGQQIARRHPERLDRLEFVCPLCKALGNMFLPIIWRGKDESFPGVLQPEIAFDDWLNSHIGVMASRYRKQSVHSTSARARQQEIFASTISETVVGSSIVGTVDRGLPDAEPQSPTLPSATVDMPGGYPEENASPTNVALSETMAFDELLLVYGRAREAIVRNKLPGRLTGDFVRNSVLGKTDDLLRTDVLAAALGFSISAVEIAQRGVASEPGQIFLDKIASLTLTHLRIVSESASAYLAIGGSKNGGKNRTNEEYLFLHNRQLLQLFSGHPQIYEDDPCVSNVAAQRSDNLLPAVVEDAFILLAEMSVYMVPGMRMDIHHIVRICYLLEILKVVLAELLAPPVIGFLMGQPAPSPDRLLPPRTLQAFRAFLDLMSEAGAFIPSCKSQTDATLTHMYSFLQPYVLVFLRKTAILLHVRYGVDFSAAPASSSDLPEIDRLTEIMRLPTLTELFEFVSAPSPSGEPTVIRSMTLSWIRHWHGTTMANRAAQRLLLEPAHPAIFELIGLPKYYDTLLDEMMRRRCPTTGKDLVEPAICLFCGEIFCSQAVCCSSKGVGGCNAHRIKCGGHVGIFISIRKCTILYLHDGNGSWAHAPYMDKHGEVDPGLRRSRQLMLNQKRYDALQRSVWLHHGIPTLISRKLEADINNGGWETL